MSFNRSFLPSWLLEAVNPFTGLKGDNIVAVSDVREYNYEDYLSALASVHCHQGSGEAEDILWSSLRAL